MERCVRELTSRFYGEWLAEVAAVKRAFEVVRQGTRGAAYLPDTVAQALEVVALRQRLQSLLDEHKASPPCSRVYGF